MIRTISVLLVGACLACAGPGAQSSTTEPRERTTEQQIAAALKEGRDPQKIRVCEYEEVTGSHIRKVTCRNLDDSEQQRAATQRQLVEMRSATPKLQ